MKGHVFKRGTKWSYKFDGSADPLTGKRRQVAKGGLDSEREAWAACRDAIKALESGRHVRSSRRKLGAYLTDEWLAAMRHVIKPTTFASYEDYARAEQASTRRSLASGLVTPRSRSRSRSTRTCSPVSTGMPRRPWPISYSGGGPHTSSRGCAEGVMFDKCLTSWPKRSEALHVGGPLTCCFVGGGGRI